MSNVGKYICRNFIDNQYTIGKIVLEHTQYNYIEYIVLESNHKGTVIGEIYSIENDDKIIADSLDQLNKIRVFS